MSDLDFQFDWENPQGAKGPELRATWARLTIKAGDTVITRLIDDCSRSLRESVYGPLYPIAEWITMNWWNLLHEVEVPGSARGRLYSRRHNLRFAGEGFALPDIKFAPTGRTTDLTWSRRAYPAARRSFVEEGSLTADTDSVREQFERFVTAVVARLESEQVAATPLQEEWAAIQAADSDETEFCKVAASLGEDPFAMDDGARDQLIDVAGRVPAGLVDEFFAATDFGHMTRALAGVEKSVANLSKSCYSLPRLRYMRETPRPCGDTPWHAGYLFARVLRTARGLKDDLFADNRSLAEAIDCDPSAFQHAVHSAPVGDLSFDALVAPAADGNPAFVTSKHRETSQRFAFCRALYEYLTSGQGQATPTALVSHAHSDRQRANRAFAAEFLAPASLLRESIDGTILDQEAMDELGAHFGVSSWVIRHQITNHKIAEIVQ